MIYDTEGNPAKRILTIGQGRNFRFFSFWYGQLGYDLIALETPMAIQRTRGVGVLLQGGPDIQPRLYNERIRYARFTVPFRDSLEYQLLQMADDRKLPVLGVCRGMQIMNVFYGGTLHQDLHLDQVTTLEHEGHHHLVEGRPGSLFPDAFPANSYHHQAVYKLGAKLHVQAVAPDGVIEAIDDGKRLMGVQWHPEQLNEPVSETLFAEHVERVRVLGKRRKARNKKKKREEVAPEL